MSLKHIKSAELVETLAAVECPALTMRRARRAELAGADYDPIIWKHAAGSNVVDVDGNRYVDMTAGFGVAAVGHNHPAIVRALNEQANILLHALGDVHPSDIKIKLLERVASLAPWQDARVILGLSGSDAIEAALKTAMLATHKPGILAFDGAYHGLSHGPLAACGYQAAFRAPFSSQLNPHVVFAPYPSAHKTSTFSQIEQIALRDKKNIGAILVEPILGRGGVVIPPPDFLKQLSALAKDIGALLIVDEVLTGLGRCGSLLSHYDSERLPDIICLGKALGGGLPISACLAPLHIMQAWGDPDKEAIHTGTFFGNPLSCATALATLDLIESENLCEQSARTGTWLINELIAVTRHHACVSHVRGQGLLVGIEFVNGASSLKALHSLLEHGYITLVAGKNAEVISLTPPLNIDATLLDPFLKTLDDVLDDIP